MDLSKLRMDPRRLTSSVQKRDGASGHRRKEGSREKPARAPGVNAEERQRAQAGNHQHENYEQHSRQQANSVVDLTLPPPPANHNWAGPQPSPGLYSGPPPRTISTQTAGFLFVAQTIRLVLKLSQKRAIHSAFQQWKSLAKNDQLDAELARHEKALVGLQQRLGALCGNEIEEEKASPSPSLPELISLAPPPWLPNLEVDLPFRGLSNASPALTIVNGSEVDSEDSWGDFVSSKNRLSFDATPDNATEHSAFSHRTMLETTFHRVANNSLHFLDQNGWLQVASEHGWDLRGASQAFRHFASMRHGHLGLDFEAFTNAIEMLASDAQRSLEDFLLNTNGEDKPAHVDTEPKASLSSSDSKNTPQNNAEKMVNQVMTGRQQQAALRSLFRTYATVRGNASCLTNARFAKMCRDCGVADLVRSGRLRHADIDLAFTKAVSKAQNHQVADFNTICRAIGMLGHRAFVCAESDTLSYSDTGFFRLRAHIIATSVEGI